MARRRRTRGSGDGPEGRGRRPSQPGTTVAEGGEGVAASMNLLDRLLYKGVLPRYAFPTDVAAFYVFDRDNSTGYRPQFLFSPSQALPIALSQYAPGKEVWIASRRFMSGAIYSPYRGDLPDMWAKRRLYYECEICHHATTKPLDEGDKGEVLDCPACGSSHSLGPGQVWVRPPGFAHPVFVEEGVSTDDHVLSSYATRAKLLAPTPLDDSHWRRLNDRVRVHHLKKHLLVTNRGPRDEGYNYCTLCGYIEPTAVLTPNVTNAHPKPFPDSREPQCRSNRPACSIVLGTDFVTDILLISLRVMPPVTVEPSLLATDVALRTLCEAITIAACRTLDLELNELRAEYRPALTEDGRQGLEAEIFLYDTLPGGAGFSRQVGDVAEEVFETALRILETCAGDCDRSCYRCLRSYKNKWEHDILDRKIGAELLRYALTGAIPCLEKNRVSASTRMLCEDLLRQGMRDVSISPNSTICVPGLGEVCAPIHITSRDGQSLVVGLAEPLCTDTPCQRELTELAEFSPVHVKLVNEVVVRAGLPRATQELIGLIREL